MMKARAAPDSGIVVDCPAKINLYLRVLAKEKSGYHQIVTLFQAVGLYDQVHVCLASPGVHLDLKDGPTLPGLASLCQEIGPPEKNTVVRAAHAFYEAVGTQPSVKITLTKAIPAGTGLGGGSADAAGLLLALNRALTDSRGCPLDATTLIKVGGKVGSDVPFFCSQAATAIGWGRGDQVMPVNSPPPAHVVIVVPHERSPTESAYKQVSRAVQLPAPAANLADLASGDWERLATIRRNDFEAVLFPQSPPLRNLYNDLVASGASLAGMSGSGSVLFAVFNDFATAEEVAHHIRRKPAVEAAGVVPVLRSDSTHP